MFEVRRVVIDLEFFSQIIIQVHDILSTSKEKKAALIPCT